MVRKTAWFLNLDAEDELARPAGYSPSRAMLARMATLTPHVRRLLCSSEDVVVPDCHPAAPLLPLSLDPTCRALAWCPTPRALRALRRTGASLPPTPALETLQTVNHRRFNATLGQTLPHAHFAQSLPELRATLANPSPTGQWLLKRPFGYAGRGRQRVNPSDPADLRHAEPWMEASLRDGAGLQVEPLVERAGDFALHGYLHATGAIELGQPTRQDCDATGAWNGSVRAAPGDLAPPERQALFDNAHRAGEALFRAGYFGPFGIDAFRWTDATGQAHFNPRCEINARYSMGWPVGMGPLRPDLDDGAPR